MFIRDAVPGDATAIADTMRRTFDPSVIDATIYGCPGVSSFIARHIAGGHRSPNRYKVLCDGENVRGAAEFRVSSETLFLSYIAVLPGRQGGGGGRDLLKAMLPEAHALGATRFALDVFVSNVKAREWYERLGLQAEADRTFWIGPPGGASPAPWFVIPDLPQADAVHEAFGFSEFSVERRGITRRVGRLSTRYFRVLGSEAAGDEDLRGFLRELDPRRELIAIFAGEPASPAQWRRLVVARRMSVALDGLRL